MVQSGILFDKARNRSIMPLGGDQEPNWRLYDDVPIAHREPTPEQKRMIDDSYQEALKEVIKDQAKQRERFNSLVKRSSQTLYKIKTVFPYNFFPTTVSIDPQKVTLQIKNFFSSSEIRSIHIKNISHVFVDTGPFFATLVLIDQSILDDNVGKIQIPYLKKQEALKARRIIQGLIVAHKEEIDITKLSDDNVVRKLEEIGRMQ